MSSWSSSSTASAFIFSFQQQQQVRSTEGLVDRVREGERRGEMGKTESGTRKNGDQSRISQNSVPNTSESERVVAGSRPTEPKSPLSLSLGAGQTQPQPNTPNIIFLFIRPSLLTDEMTYYLHLLSIKLDRSEGRIVARTSNIVRLRPPDRSITSQV